MRFARPVRWALAVVAVLAVAAIGVFANLAVLRSGTEESAIGSLSAKGIAKAQPSPGLAADDPPLPPAPGTGDHHDRDNDNDNDNDDD
jgi:hypothetical protein